MDILIIIIIIVRAIIDFNTAKSMGGYFIESDSASCGLVENYQSSGVDKYRSFNVGALNSDKYSNTQERKASYSNMGNGIDYWTIGDVQ